MKRIFFCLSGVALLLSLFFLGSCTHSIPSHSQPNYSPSGESNKPPSVANQKQLPEKKSKLISNWQKPKVSDAIGFEAGGPLIPEQAAYDARHYDLNLAIDPDRRTISGTVTVKAKVLSPLTQFVLDLDLALKVSSVRILGNTGKKDLHFEHKPFEKATEAELLQGSKAQNSRLWINLNREYHAGEILEIAITYAGNLRTATNPPFNGGFTWEKTEQGLPWIGVSCFFEGADIWWPVKDHPSDEPDEGVSLHFTVPASLDVLSNGRFEGKTQNPDGTATHHWRVTTTINTYNVTFNAGPFRKIQENYRSTSGLNIPVTFWVLPEHYEEGKALFPQLIQTIHFFETLLGPYPFQGDKLAVVDTPYLGMEHQTIVSFGMLGRTGNPDPVVFNGFNMLQFHELGHEWFGNLVSASDFRDIWLQETFDVYMTALYFEYQYGKAAYHEYVASMNTYAFDHKIVAPLEAKTGRTMFFYKDSNYSMSKGFVVLHTLRYLIGDKHFFELLRRQAYPEIPTIEDIKRCSQCRSTSSEEFITLAEEVSGRDLRWFFDLYLRRPELPKLITEDVGDILRIRWDVPEGLHFPMPVEIERNGQRERIVMLNGEAQIKKQASDNIIVDPDFWILRQARPDPDKFGTLLKFSENGLD